MKYLVTGGAGFIGSHLTDTLVASGDEVVVVDDLSAGFKRNLSLQEGLKIIIDKVQCLSQDQFSDIDGIFHMAAQASVPVSVEEFYYSSTNNLQSTFWVYDLARKLDVPVVYASSSAIYGNLPLGNDSIEKFEILSPYALDKLTMEQYANLCSSIYNIGSIGLRFFNVYGPRQDPKNPYSGVISIFIDRFKNKQKVIINGGYQTRDFIYIKDIVYTIIKSMNLLRKNKKCLFINIGTGYAITINDLYNKLTEIFDYSPLIEYRPLEKSDPERSDGVFDKLKQDLNIDNSTFTPIEEGLRETVKYFLNNE